MRVVVVLLSALCLLDVEAQAPKEVSIQDIKSAAPAQVAVLVEYISIDTDTALTLVAGDASVPTREAIQPLLADGEAEVEELAYVLTRSGSQAQVESIIELIYPTDYHPANVPQTVAGPLRADNEVSSPPAATAFSIRNLGITLRATPQVGPTHKYVQMDIATDLTLEDGEDGHGAGPHKMRWPRFRSLPVTTEIGVASGECALVGLIGNDASQSFLVFVTPTVLPLTSNERALELWFPGAKLVDSSPVLEAGDPFAAGDPIDDPFGASEETEATMVADVLVEIIQVPLEDIAEMLTRVVLSNVEELRQSLELSIAQGRAHVIDTIVTSSSSAQRSQTRSGSERIYPVEMSRPDGPRILTGPVDLFTGMPMSSFEMRPTGLSLNLNPQVGPDNTTIDLSIALQSCLKRENRSYGLTPSQMQFPIFATNRLATNVSVLSGECLLLGIFSERATDGRNRGLYSLVFTHARVTGNEP